MSKVTKAASKVLRTFTVLLVASIAASSVAHADEFDRIEHQAKKIQRKAKLLTKETTHYRHTAQYDSLVRETAALCDAATHIVKVVHFKDNLHVLKSDLAIIDACFQDIEYLFDATEHAASLGKGKVRGRTGHVKALLNSIDSCIGLIRRDVDRLVRAAERSAKYQSPKIKYVPAKPIAKPAIPYRQPARSCDYGRPSSRGVSFSIGGGSSRMTFRF